MGHIHLEGSLPAPDVEARGGLLVVLACGVFRAVVVVDDWLLALLLAAGGGGTARLPDLAGVVWFPGFAADDVYCRGGVNRNS